jgi:hypothetical protein
MRIRAFIASVAIACVGLAIVASPASAHSAFVQVGCQAVAFSFSGFPATAGNVVEETITVDGSVVYDKPFTFDGASGANSVTIDLTGSHTVNATATWNTNGVSGSGTSGDVPLSCGTCPQNSITSNFNGAAIAAGNYIWFNSAIKVQGVPASGGFVNLTNVHVTFTAGGVPYTIDVPGSQITLSPSTTTATTYFSKGQEWITHVPASFGDNIFLTGVAWQVPAPGLPGGIQHVTWQGDFTVASGMTMSWQWAGAVYTQFVPEPPLGSNEQTNSYTLLNVKVVHSTTLDAYHNGDQVGTPENRTNPTIPQPINGARGGGASNFTGSYSATGHCP